MTNLPRVIGLYSPAPQQGKSTVAQYLRNSYGYSIVSFATPLKRMASHMLHGLGYSPQEIDGFLTEGKSIRLAEIGVDTRHILQTLGAEWGRESPPELRADLPKARTGFPAFRLPAQISIIFFFFLRYTLLQRLR